ncbi:MAG: hypothetical protein WD716_00525 [Fimbriimonadaceae bacterium]
MNNLTRTAAIAVLAIVPAMIFAQPQRGQGGPPQGGQGMMRGGMMGGGMMSGGPAILFRTDVQKELKLTQEQIEKLREVVPGGPGGRGGFGGPGGPPRGQGGQQGGVQGGQGQQRQQGGPPEGGRRMGQNPEEMQKIDSAVKGVLNDSQYKRYHELDLQLSGPMAVLRPDVSEKLKITDEQRQQIMQAMRPQGGPGAGGQRGQGGVQGGRGGQGGQRQQGGPPQGFDPAQMEQRRKEQEAKVLALLTDAQRRQWTQMLGKKFEFEKMGPPPGAGPGGGGAPGVRGGGN